MSIAFACCGYLFSLLGIFVWLISFVGLKQAIKDKHLGVYIAGVRLGAMGVVCAATACTIDYATMGATGTAAMIAMDHAIIAVVLNAGMGAIIYMTVVDELLVMDAEKRR